jgi:hypothetical protein
VVCALSSLTLEIEVVESLPLSLLYKGQDVTAANVPEGTDYYDPKRKVIYLCAVNTNFSLVKKLSGMLRTSWIALVFNCVFVNMLLLFRLLFCFALYRLTFLSDFTCVTDFFRSHCDGAGQCL